jgi:DNA repair exonuclease SbcCD ATPase subunit
MFESHKSINLDKYTKDFFTGYCKEENHPFELEYYCKTHKQLCCAKCVIKIGNKKDAVHKNCNVCTIEDIKDEKIHKLNENIKKLEKLSQTLEEEIRNLKNIFEKITTKKEEIKLDIQKIFTKIRSELNEREDELLKKVDTIFDNTFIQENNIKDAEKLPNKVKLSMEKCKKINLQNDKLNSLINDCLNIEKDINTIDTIKEKINDYNDSNKLNIRFSSNHKDEINRTY